MSDSKQLPVEVYPLPDRHGFNILHEPKDKTPCTPDDKGQCHNIDHLWPLAKPKGDA